MAPEQACGWLVDKRADIWAFGVVLYEMLTGHPLFKGESINDVLASVLAREPDWTRVPAEAPHDAAHRALPREFLLSHIPDGPLRVASTW